MKNEQDTERHPVRDHGKVQEEVAQHREDMDTAKKIIEHARKEVHRHAKEHHEEPCEAAERIGGLLAEMKPHEWHAALAKPDPQTEGGS